jgi:hypothetical protein
LTCYNLVEDIVQIPKERIFINDIVLDEELQLERELYWAEMAPIDAAWANIQHRATWSQALPMAIFPPHILKELGSTAMQSQFLEALVWKGMIGVAEAARQVRRCSFQSAFELMRERFSPLSTTEISEVSDLMYELRRWVA